MDGRVPSDELWRVALDLNRAAAAVDPRAAGLPPLIFMTDPGRTPEPWRTAARLPAGSAVIYRGFGRPEAAAEANRLREVTFGADVRLLIAGDAELALTIRADGVHLPERDLERAPGLRAERLDWILTGAVHAAASAVPPCLDAVLISPVFPQGGTSPARPPLGVEGLAEMIQSIRLPAYALGGIDAARAHRLAAAGPCGIAAVGAVTTIYGL